MNLTKTFLAVMRFRSTASEDKYAIVADNHSSINYRRRPANTRPFTPHKTPQAEFVEVVEVALNGDPSVEKQRVLGKSEREALSDVRHVSRCHLPSPLVRLQVEYF